MLNEHYDVTTAAYAVGYESYPISVGNIRGCLESVALNANSLADNVELDETVVTVIPTHGAIARATFNAQIGGKVLMTLKYGNKSVPFGAIVTHGENKNGSIVAENGQVYLTGLPQSGQLQVSWGKDKNSNCIVEYKLPEVSPGTLLNQQTAICR